MRTITLLLTALALVAAACGGGIDAPSDGDPGGDAGPPTGSWQLVGGEGPDGPIPVLPDHPITLIFEDGGGISGTAACNHYFGEVTVQGDALAIGEIGATEMACTPEVVMQAERRYLDALGAVAAVERSGEQLVLRGPGTRLEFAPVED